MTPAELRAALQDRFPELQPLPETAGQIRGPELAMTVPVARWAEVARFIRYDPPLYFDALDFLTAIDWKDRFELVLAARSTLHRHRLVLRSTVLERAKPEIASVTGVWPAADWQEREVFDLFGIRFTGHYNLRRILLPEEWTGYPLRKADVPVKDRFD